MNLLSNVAAFAFGCTMLFSSAQASAVAAEEYRRDTLRIELPRCGISVNFSLRDLGVTQAEIDSYSEDDPFYVTMDDIAYYLYEADAYCAKNAIPMIYADTTIRIVYFGNGSRIDLCDSTSFNLFWNILLYDHPQKPKVVSTLEFYESADAYFGLETTADE